MRFSSWSNLDKTLSEKALTLSIGAALLAHLIFLNQHVRDFLQSFIAKYEHHGSCSIFIDSTESKLMYLYLGTFFLGLAAALIKFFMPAVIKLYSLDEFVKAHESDELETVYAHFESNVPQDVEEKLANRGREATAHRALVSLVVDSRLIEIRAPVDQKKFSEVYHRRYYEYEQQSTFAAPLAKIALILSALILACQAVKTFLAVSCLQIAIALT